MRSVLFLVALFAAPLVAQDQYQVNQLECTLTANGLPDPGPNSPISANPTPSGIHQIQLSSRGLAGQSWEFAFTIGSPSVPLSAGGVATANGQTFNIDLTWPPTFLWNGFQSPPFVDTTFAVQLPRFEEAAAQLAILNPASPDGYSLSHAVELFW